VIQTGTADEVFDQPRTRFVAEFIGRTNLLDGVAAASDTVTVGRLRFRVAGTGVAPGTRVAVSIRPHAIALTGPVDHPGPGVNAFRGEVKRASFLGDSVDYEIALADSDVVLRVVTPVGQRRQAGESVGLEIDPAACVTLTDASA
jgi:ABC-type Fe3+/spermidine/putrescine transport system ATPase subunit